MATNHTYARRHVNASRESVYRALLDAQAVTTWMVPEGMTSHVHEFDAREGGENLRAHVAVETLGHQEFFGEGHEWIEPDGDRPARVARQRNHAGHGRCQSRKDHVASRSHRHRPRLRNLRSG